MSYARNAVRNIRTLAPLERRKVLDVMGKARDGFRDWVIVVVALGAGLRENEIAGLDVGDVAAGARDIRSRIELRVFAHKGRKSKKPRPKTQRIYPSKLVRKALAKFLVWKKRERESLAPTAPLFCAGVTSSAGEGARISTRAMRRMWRVWQERAGFKAPLFTFHELRHTFGTTLRQRKGDLRVVQRALRHADISSTQIYAHVSDDELRAALEDQPT
jgi:integrase